MPLLHLLKITRRIIIIKDTNPKMSSPHKLSSIQMDLRLFMWLNRGLNTILSILEEGSKTAINRKAQPHKHTRLSSHHRLSSQVSKSTCSPRRVRSKYTLDPMVNITLNSSQQLSMDQRATLNSLSTIRLYMDMPSNLPSLYRQLTHTNLHIKHIKAWMRSLSFHILVLLRVNTNKYIGRQHRAVARNLIIWEWYNSSHNPRTTMWKLLHLPKISKWSCSKTSSLLIRGSSSSTSRMLSSNTRLCICSTRKPTPTFQFNSHNNPSRRSNNRMCMFTMTMKCSINLITTQKSSSSSNHNPNSSCIIRRQCLVKKTPMPISTPCKQHLLKNSKNARTPISTRTALELLSAATAISRKSHISIIRIELHSTLTIRRSSILSSRTSTHLQHLPQQPSSTIFNRWKTIITLLRLRLSILQASMGTEAKVRKLTQTSSSLREN